MRLSGLRGIAHNSGSLGSSDVHVDTDVCVDPDVHVDTDVRVSSHVRVDSDVHVSPHVHVAHAYTFF